MVRAKLPLPSSYGTAWNDGVDEKFKGLGLGASLLKDAIENALKISALAGARALVVDPVDDKAAAFYEHFGFATLPGTNRMALKL